MCLGYKRRSTRFNPLPLSVSLRSIIITSLDHSFSYLFFNPPPPPPPVLLFLFFVLFVCLLSFWSFVCFVASDVLTIICHLAIVGVCVIVILYIGNTQIRIVILYIGNTQIRIVILYIGNTQIRIVILYIGNTQISILLLCFLYLFVELVITMSE